MTDIDLDALAARHQPMRIYDECDHAHEEGAPGVVDTGEFLTCEGSYLYSICSTCCVENPKYPEQAAWCCDSHDHREGWTCDAPALIDAARRVQAVEAERDELRAEVERLTREWNAFTAYICPCGHTRESHTPLDFGDCSECPHGTCGKYPGLKWDIWHRDTLRERDEARAEVERLRVALGREEAAGDEAHARATAMTTRALAAERERDESRAAVARVKALCDGSPDRCDHGMDCHCDCIAEDDLLHALRGDQP